jgi:hypothetical protein
MKDGMMLETEPGIDGGTASAAVAFIKIEFTAYVVGMTADFPYGNAGVDMAGTSE